ncbi:MAG: protein-methionine-sulfoxide reductase catalytic subunit MsrP [Limisphaerales bacterium]
MAQIITRPDWHIPESEVTPEHIYRNRRKFLKEMSFVGASALLAQSQTARGASPYPAKRNGLYSPPLHITPPKYALQYNNFYEFTTDKSEVAEVSANFRTSPWKIKAGGLCDKAVELDTDDLVREFGLEERVYRFRCVEAWGMVVPWTGFPLHKLLRKLKPSSDAKFVKFATALKPDEMPGIAKLPHYPWPYTEGLRMDEAMHDLTMVVTGIYGKRLPPQNGAPIRLIIPWKYGFKSIKSIDSIEFTREKPKTLWETAWPAAYPFLGNVEPDVPHPKWSQKRHKDIETKIYVPTKHLNGYAKQVGHLY